MTQRCTPRQRNTAHRLTHEWAAINRKVTLQQERDAFKAAHPNAKPISYTDKGEVIDPTYVAHMASVIDRLGGEYATRIIGRTVTSLHDLTIAEASQVIDSLLRWLRKYRQR